MAPDAPAPGAPAASRARWLRVRRHLDAHRHRLARLAAAGAAPGPAAPLLARPHWVPAEPVPLERVRLRPLADAPPPPFHGLRPELDPLRPLRDDGTPHAAYADALAALARPRLLEDRACYRLLSVDDEGGAPVLGFGRARYFEGLDIHEAAAHELAAADLGEAPGTPFRDALGDPTDLARRPALPGVSTLLLRHDRRAGTAEFVLHWRDPAKVAAGGGLYQVMPAGMFQPSHDAPWNEANDFDLWRCLVRELAEELLGAAEDHGTAAAPLDYDAWPLYRELGAGRRRGDLSVHWLGLGADPLTFAVDLLTVAVVEAAFFDRVFPRLAAVNAEGRRVGAEDGTGRSVGLPFTAEAVGRLLDREPVQPAGAALLRLASRHRGALLGGGA
ncbi:XRE family transcriptional regulator [Streptomyces sp. NPDC001380]|uniref:XRE family transcriptional regulator n=1 Tax=Streptomyces sp. NPDC001380 TaxID=3364566 RepID=UPI003674A503